MHSPLELALYRVHCIAQVLHDTSKEKPVGLEEWQAMTAAVAQLAHCCAILAAAAEAKFGKKIEVEETMMEPGVLPRQYAEALEAIVNQSLE